MIFKTFENNDIDKWTAKIGLFGKSFNDVIDSINKRKLDIDNLMSSGLVSSYSDAKKQVGGLFSYLYSKKDIKSQLIDVDSVFPKIDTSNVKEVKAEIVDMSKSVSDGKKTWQELFDTLPSGKKHFAELGQQMKGQIITEEGLISANEKARASAIAHNNALKQQTLGAKAGQVALKGLAMAGNMLASFLITKGISLITKGIDNLIHRTEKIKEAAEEAKNKISSINDDLKTNTETVENAKQRYAELAQEVENLGKVSQNQGSLSADEYKEFLDLSNQLAGVFPQLTKGYDDNGKAKIDTYNKAINYYQKEASKYLEKIPANLREAAQNGAIAITEFIGDSSSEIVDYIEQYRNLDDSFANATEQVAQLRQEIISLEKEKFDNIVNAFDSIGNIVNSNKSINESQITYLETSGERIGKGYYTSLRDQSKLYLEQLNKERELLNNQLTTAMSNGVKYGSDEWKDMYSSIQSVDQAIIDTTNDIEEYNNSLRELDWSVFDDGNKVFFKKLKNDLSTQIKEVNDLYNKLFVTENDIEPYLLYLLYTKEDLSSHNKSSEILRNPIFLRIYQPVLLLR